MSIGRGEIMIFIKGMKMPRDCIECRFFELSDEYCYARGAHGSEWGKSTGCPLVEITSPIDFQKYIDSEIQRIIGKKVEE